MIDDFKRYLITAALPYANGGVHIGHLAGVYIPADIFVRYLRLKNKDVLFICGSDEHGVPITIKAKNENTTPQKIVDKYNEIIKNSFEKFGISFDIYSRTSSEIHHITASNFFKKLYKENKLIQKTTQQYFDKKEQIFLADRYITGTCPICNSDGAYGDQCEKCGSTLAATDLINPISTISKQKPILKETSHFFLPLDQYQDFLEKWIESKKDILKANVYGQCSSWLKNKLEPRAVTRDLDWGVPVPIEELKNKVLYVWFDAPIGYISATKELTDDWEKYWKDKETCLLHFIGKDNIVFHCIIFPAMLQAHGDYILPQNIPANEFMNLEQNKISTSRNWAVWLDEYLVDFPNKQDALRYTLIINAPENKDSDFTWADFQIKNNNELVATLGNFVNRALTLIHKYYNGVMPTLSVNLDEEAEIFEKIKQIKIEVESKLEKYRFKDAMKEVMGLAQLGNKFLADSEVWKVIKTDQTKANAILNTAVQITANLSILLEPFLPHTAGKIRQMLNLQEFNWEDIGKKDIIKANSKINSAELLFEKIEDEQINYQIEKLNKQKKIEVKQPISPKNDIEFDEFNKLDIRTAKIIAAEKIAKTKKLLKLTVDLGFEQRTIVSGIAEHFTPEEIMDKKVTVVINLQDREIKGILSQGMILFAENSDGKLCFVSPSLDSELGALVK